MTVAIIDATAHVSAGAADGHGASRRYVTTIANMPLIGHILDELAAAGIESVRLLAHEDVRRELERALGAAGAWDLELLYRSAQTADGELTMGTELEQALSSGPVLLHPGDALFLDTVTEMGRQLEEKNADAVLIAPGHREAKSLERAKELALLDAPVLLGVGSRECTADFGSGVEGARGLVEAILTSSCRVALSEPGEHWRYSEATEELLAANRMVLDALRVPGADGSFGQACQVHGRVALSPNAQVSNSTLYGPVSVDRGAIIEDSFVGPYTAIGAHAVVRGAELDNTVVLPGAEVHHPGLRIHASIIGERAIVERSFELPRGARLRLPPDSRMTLS